MTTRVIIVRHGQSNYNAQKIIQGRCDESVLTAKGIADARVIGILDKRYKLVKWHRWLTSQQLLNLVSNT